MDKTRELNALAEITYILVKELVENPTFAIRDAFRYVHREVITDTIASVAAFKDFYSKTGKDIRTFDWYGGKVKALDGSIININQSYTMEHMTTGKDYKDILIRAYKDGNLTIDFIKEQLQKQQLCWVTKAEDKRLKELGYNSERPDPQKAYADARIQIYTEEMKKPQKAVKAPVASNMRNSDTGIEQSTFWELYSEALSKHRNPFLINPRNYYTSVNRKSPTTTSGIVIEFSLQKQILRIGVYLHNNLPRYEFFLKNKAEFERLLGFKPTWEHGERGPTTRRIFTELEFRPYDHADYVRAIEESIPLVKHYVDVFDEFLK